MWWVGLGIIVFLVGGWLGLFWWLIPYPDLGSSFKPAWNKEKA